MKLDPFTLRVALDKRTGAARGELYLDDGESYAHRAGNIVWREFAAKKAEKGKVMRLTNQDLAQRAPGVAVDGVALAKFDPANEFAQSIAEVRVEKIVVLGLGAKPARVDIEGGRQLEWTYMPGVAAGDKKEGSASVLTIKDPGTAIARDWAIIIQL